MSEVGVPEVSGIQAYCEECGNYLLWGLAYVQFVTASGKVPAISPSRLNGHSPGG